jgi:sugar-specific transcriptional regulator TrmB
MVSIEERLRLAGLTGNESKVYLSLLTSGLTSAQELAKQLGMDRSLTYTVLNNLIEKGFASLVLRESKRYFHAAEPRNLLNPLLEKEAIIKDLIPELDLIKTKPQLPYQIDVYEGKNGLKMYINALLKCQEILVFGATGRMYDLFYESPRIVQDAQRLKIHAKIISHPRYREHISLKLSWLKTRFLPAASNVTTTIFGNKVSFHILTEKPLMIVITHKDIAEGYKNYFHVLWNTARE